MKTRCCWPPGEAADGLIGVLHHFDGGKGAFDLVFLIAREAWPNMQALRPMRPRVTTWRTVTGKDQSRTWALGDVADEGARWSRLRRGICRGR